jgi:hypothetical protein
MHVGEELLEGLLDELTDARHERPRCRGGVRAVPEPVDDGADHSPRPRDRFASVAAGSFARERASARSHGDAYP